MDTIMKPIDSLKLSPYNPREMLEQEFAKLKLSIQEFGFVEPIVINKAGMIIGGHMRWRAAKELGLKEVPCVEVDLPPEKEKLLNLALNRISGRWDNQKLGELVSELAALNLNMDLSGFDKWELEYYNAGPDEIQGGGITGVLPNESFRLIFIFDSKEDYEKCSKHFCDGKVQVSVNGTKLLDLING